MSTEDLIIRIKQEYDGKGLKELKTALTSVQGDIDKFRGTNVNAFNESITRAGVLTEKIGVMKNEYKGITAEAQKQLQQEKAITNEKKRLQDEYLAKVKQINSDIASIGKQNAQAEIQNAKSKFQQQLAEAQKNIPYMGPSVGPNVSLGSQEHLSALRKYQNTLSATSPEFAKIQREITAVNSSLATHKGQLTQSTSSWTQFGANFTVIAAGVGIALSKINQYLGDIAREFFKAELASQKLQFATKGNAEGLIQYADALQQTSIYENDATIDAMSFLATQGRTEAQIKKTIQTAADMSAVIGGDLNENMRKLDMTYEGSLGRLGKLDGGLKNLTKKELENGAAVELLGEKYKGMAEVVGNTTYGQVEKFKNSLGDLKESLGKGFFEGMTVGLANIADKSEDLTTKLEKQKSSWQKIGDILGFVARNTGIIMFLEGLGNTISGVTKGVNDLAWALGVLNATKAGFTQKGGVMDILPQSVKDAINFSKGVVILKPEGAQEGKPSDIKTGTGSSGSNASMKQEIEYTDELIEKRKQLLEFESKRQDLLLNHPELTGESNIILKNLEEQKKLLTEINWLIAERSKFVIDIGKFTIPENEDLQVRKGYDNISGIDPYNPKKNKQQLDYEAKKYNEIADKGLSLAGQLASTLNIGVNTAVMRLVSGLQEGLSLARSIAEFLNMIHIGGGFLSWLIPGGAAVGGMPSGIGGGGLGKLMLKMIGGNAVNNNYSPNITVLVSSEIEKVKAVKFLNKHLPLEKKYRLSKQ